MRRFLGLAFFFLTVFAKAQTITITAKVVDSETREPIHFASISLQGKSISTITNQQGEFDFHFPNEYRNDLFVVSILGYENFEAPAWTMVDKAGLVISLKKLAVYLDEIIVSDTLTGGDILQIALANISKNYPMSPYLMDGFYRDLKKVGGTYISSLEAAVKIYDEDYREPRNKFKLRERVNLIEVRRSLGYGNKFTSYFDSDNLLEDLLLHNNVRYRQFPEEDIFYENLQRAKDSYYNGQPVYVVRNMQDYSLTLYVDKQTYGIIHLEYENSQESPIGKRKGLYSKFSKVKRVIDFKMYGSKMYLNYLTIDSQINWYDIKTNHLQFETSLNQQLLINEIYPHTDEWIGTTQKMKDYGLQYQDLPYNKAFWDNYNVIKESPLEKKIIEDLEKDMPLEKQFKY